MNDAFSKPALFIRISIPPNDDFIQSKASIISDSMRKSHFLAYIFPLPVTRFDNAYKDKREKKRRNLRFQLEKHVHLR